MVDLELLAHRARVASEWGRVRMAGRIAVPIATLVAIPAALGPGGGGFAALLLLATAIFLRWHSRFGIEVVRAGLLVGAASVTTMLAIRAATAGYLPVAAILPAAVASVLAGALSVLGGARSTSGDPRGPGRRARWLLSLLVALLTVCVGTAGFGGSSAASRDVGKPSATSTSATTR